MIKEAIKLATEGKDLSVEQATEAMTEIMTGVATQAQTAAYLTALVVKGESVDEITASAKAMRAVAAPCPIGEDCMDIVGTGGDGANSFNISTCSSFVVAAGGVKVAKHGNGSVSSKSGAADVLAALGVNTKAAPEKTGEIFKEYGYAFLHAQLYHPAMRFAAPVRKELGIRTIFNILGPLANPAHADKQLLGVYTPKLVKTLATVLSNLGVKRVIAVSGTDGLDEVSLSAPTACCEIIDGKAKEYEVTAKDFGLPARAKSDLVGGTPEENAKIFLSVLAGEKSAYRDAVVANSALSFVAAGKVKTPADGAAYAAEVIDGGEAEKLFIAYKGATNS